MTKTSTQRLLDLAKQDLAEARDNLIRARAASVGRDIYAQCGQSTQSLLEIIQGYENWEIQALEVVALAEKL